MELITNDIEVKENQILPMKLTNFEDLKREIVNKMQEYKEINVTADKLKEAKEYRANLNKFEKAIAEQRKNKTKEAEEKVGLTQYINDCKQLEQYVKDASIFLDKQIKAFEQKEDDEKLKIITDFFIENTEEFAGLIDFDKIYNKKWLNKTYKIEDIQTEIKHIVTKTRTDFNVIKTQFENENIQKQVQQYYLNNIDDTNVLTLAILEGNKITEQNKKLEELKQKEAEINKNIPENEKNITNTIQNVPKSGRLVVIDFRVECTRTQMELLKDFLKANNIKYGPVPKN